MSPTIQNCLWKTLKNNKKSYCYCFWRDAAKFSHTLSLPTMKGRKQRKLSVICCHISWNFCLLCSLVVSKKIWFFIQKNSLYLCESTSKWIPTFKIWKIKQKQTKNKIKLLFLVCLGIVTCLVLKIVLGEADALHHDTEKEIFTIWFLQVPPQWHKTEAHPASLSYNE